MIRIGIKAPLKEPRGSKKKKKSVCLLYKIKIVNRARVSVLLLCGVRFEKEFAQ